MNSANEYILTGDDELCSSTATHLRLYPGYVVPRDTLALVTVLAEMLVDLLLGHLHCRPEVPRSGRRIDRFGGGLPRRVDPLPGALDDDLDGGRRAANEGHRATFDDVERLLRLDVEDGRDTSGIGGSRLRSGRRSGLDDGGAAEREHQN